MHLRVLCRTSLDCDLVKLKASTKCNGLIRVLHIVATEEKICQDAQINIKARRHLLHYGQRMELDPLRLNWAWSIFPFWES